MECKDMFFVIKNYLIDQKNKDFALGSCLNFTLLPEQTRNRLIVVCIPYRTSK